MDKKSFLLSSVAVVSLLAYNASIAYAENNESVDSTVYGPQYKSNVQINQISEHTPLTETYSYNYDQNTDGTIASSSTQSAQTDSKTTTTSDNSIETNTGVYNWTSIYIRDVDYNYYYYENYASAYTSNQTGNTWNYYYYQPNGVAVFTGIGGASLNDVTFDKSFSLINLSTSTSGGIAFHKVTGNVTSSEKAELTLSSYASSNSSSWRHNSIDDNYYDGPFEQNSTWASASAGRPSYNYNNENIYNGIDIQATGNAKIDGSKISIAGNYIQSNLNLSNNNEDIISTQTTNTTNNQFTVSGSLDLANGKVTGSESLQIGVDTIARSDGGINSDSGDNYYSNYNYNHTSNSVSSYANAGNKYNEYQEKDIVITASGNSDAEFNKYSASFTIGHGNSTEKQIQSKAVDAVSARITGSKGSAIAGETNSRTYTQTYNYDYHATYYDYNQNNFYWHLNTENTATTKFEASSNTNVPVEVNVASSVSSQGQTSNNPDDQMARGSSKNKANIKGSNITLESETSADGYTYDQQCSWYNCSYQQSDTLGAETYSSVSVDTNGYGSANVNHEANSAAVISRNENDNRTSTVSTTVTGNGGVHEASPGIFTSTINVTVSQTARTK